MVDTQNIWVTRPAPNSNSTVQRLKELEFKPVVTPLMTYEWRYEKGSDKFLNSESLMSAEIFAVTSQAVFLANWDDDAREEICSKPIYCVGQKTALAAKKFGAQEVIVGSGNGGALGQLLGEVSQNYENPLKVTYLTGAPRRDAFENALSNFNTNLSVKEVYHSNYATNFPDSIKDHWCSGNIHVVLLYSAHASLSFLSCLNERSEESGHENDSKPILLCLSHDVAKPLMHYGFDIKVASQPNEAKLLALLQG